MLENTCIVICADHGFSFSGNPLRDSFVINLYLENYNIPCVITGAGNEGMQIEDIHTSKDIPATICELAFGFIPPEFSGKSILSNDKYSYVDIEYCGGGCPDLSRRKLKIAAFDKQYFVGTLGSLSDEDEIITEVYDLLEDPLQYKNLAEDKYDIEKAGPLIEWIRKRRSILCEYELECKK